MSEENRNIEGFNREKFNTDPKHEQERNQFDAMVEDAFERVAKKKAPADDVPVNFFDALFKRITG